MKKYILVLILALCSNTFGESLTFGPQIFIGEDRVEYPLSQGANSTGSIYLLERIKDDKFLVAFPAESGEHGSRGEYFSLKFYIGQLQYVGLKKETITIKRAGAIECDTTLTEDDAFWSWPIDESTANSGWGTCMFGAIAGEADIAMIDTDHFAVVYRQVGPGGGCHCNGDNWGTLRIGRINNNNRITFGHPVYYNGLNCHVDAQGVGDNDLCPDSLIPGSQCGDTTTEQCYNGQGGTNNAVEYLGDSKLLITYRDVTITAKRQNAARIAVVNLNDLTATISPRFDTYNNRSESCDYPQLEAGRQCRNSNTLKIGSYSVKFWSIDQEGWKGISIPIGYGNNRVHYGCYDAYAENASTAYEDHAQYYIFNPLAVDLGSNKFVLMFYQKPYTYEGTSYGGIGKYRIGSIEGEQSYPELTYEDVVSLSGDGTIRTGITKLSSNDNYFVTVGYDKNSWSPSSPPSTAKCVVECFQYESGSIYKRHTGTFLMSDLTTRYRNAPKQYDPNVVRLSEDTFVAVYTSFPDKQPAARRIRQP